jgi:hypothetical protein
MIFDKRAKILFNSDVGKNWIFTYKRMNLNP